MIEPATDQGTTAESEAALNTNKDLDRLALDLPHIKAWVSAIEAELQKQLETGETFQNVKLVPTRPSRKWLEGLDVRKALRKFSPLDVIAPRVVLTPAQAEKTLGKKLFKDKLAKSVVSQSSGVKLAYCNEEELEN